MMFSNSRLVCVSTAGVLALLSQAVLAADLSPAKWSANDRSIVERQEARNWAPSYVQALRDNAGVISATESPIAVQAGLEALRRGGNAADAATTIAMTQIATELGSVVSYAGIISALYYDAKTGAIYSLDGGWNSYRNEREPLTIPASDTTAVSRSQYSASAKDMGRQTLVPGFMAGIEALQHRFGRLAFGELLAPAIWYADHGVQISGALDFYFKDRRKELSRTPEGLAFLHQTGNDLPEVGDIFRQPQLANTLRAVARNGSAFMYTGAWAKAFVSTVQREGGRVTAEDLANYRPIWSEPAHTNVFSHEVYVAGPPNPVAYQLLTALSITEALHLDQRGPYWKDPQTFRDLNRSIQIVGAAPNLPSYVTEPLRKQGIDVSAEGQRSKVFATALASELPTLFAAPSDRDPHHSDAIVVADKEGNIAALTHTINTVIWGDTGIVVDGIPIPDAAGFQQNSLSRIAPGRRLPNNIPEAIVLDGDHRPVFATAGIGGSLVVQTLATIVSVTAQRQDAGTVAAAPPLIYLNPVDYTKPLGEQPLNIPTGMYDRAFVSDLKKMGITVVEVPNNTVAGARGTLAMVAIDPGTQEKITPDTPGVNVFGGLETTGLNIRLPPSLGVRLDPSQRGAIISRVLPHSAAEEAGLKAGDLVVALNGSSILTAKNLVDGIAALMPRANVDLSVLRNGKKMDIRIALGS